MSGYSQDSYPTVPGHSWHPKKPGVCERLIRDDDPNNNLLWHYHSDSTHPKSNATKGWHSKFTGDEVAYTDLREALIDLCLKGAISGPIGFDNPFVPADTYVAEAIRNIAETDLRSVIPDFAYNNGMASKVRERLLEIANSLS